MELTDAQSGDTPCLSFKDGTTSQREKKAEREQTCSAVFHATHMSVTDLNHTTAGYKSNQNILDGGNDSY